MEEILKSIATPAWWFSAIAIALLINVASYYLTTHLDGFFRWLSKKYRIQQEKMSAEFSRKVARVKEDSEFKSDLFNDEIRFRMYAQMFTLLFMICAAIGSGEDAFESKVASAWYKLLFGLLGIGCLVAVAATFHQAGNITRVLLTAREPTSTPPGGDQ